MGRDTNHGAMQRLVDVHNGIISREIFVNDAIYQQEQEQVFARAWLFIGHESQIPKPGDYFVTGMGEESVILTRAATGMVHAFLNTCRHRGMKVCRYDERQGTERLAVSIPAGGHGALTPLQTDDLRYIPTYQNTPIVEEYFRHAYEEREDVLRQVNGQWQIARRKILLDQNVLLAKNLTLFF
jgi:hypothetical protein